MVFVIAWYQSHTWSISLINVKTKLRKIKTRENELFIRWKYVLWSLGNKRSRRIGYIWYPSVLDELLGEKQEKEKVDGYAHKIWDVFFPLDGIDRRLREEVDIPHIKEIDLQLSMSKLCQCEEWTKHFWYRQWKMSQCLVIETAKFG